MASENPDLPASTSLPVSVEAMLRAVNAHAIVSITDVSGTILYTNDLFCRISGYRTDELIGRNHRIIKSGRHPPEFYHDMWATIAAGQVWQGEVCNRHKDGDLYWVQATITPCLDDQGLPTHFISLRTDITQQRLQVDQIAQLAFEQDELLRLAPVGIARLEQRTFSRLNSAFASMLGYSVDELRGHSTRSIYFSDEQFDAMGQAAYESLRQGHIYSAEACLRGKDGQGVWVIWGICSLTPETPTLNTLFLIQDISAHKALEEKLGVALAESQAAERAKSAFLDAMTHEMHTPLNGILGGAQILALQIPDGDDRVLIDEMMASANHLLHMIDAALTFAAEVDTASPEVGEVAVIDLVSRGIWETRNLAKTWHVEVVQQIPDAIGQRSLRVDQPMLLQVLKQVLDNAIRYNRDGGQVAVSVSGDDTELRLEVSDSGLGMSPEQLARLGQPFVRFCADGNRPGAGLGMSIAYRLAQKLGVRLAVSSEPGQGTRVVLTVPASLLAVSC